MSTTVTRISIQAEDLTEHKVAVVSSNANGIYVSAPYHQARQGQFICTKVQDRVGIQSSIPKYKYSANSRAKLSLLPPNASHPDSFLVHFSGNGIVSGFDANGKPKGCALKGPPMPEITTGPTFGLLVWGLSDFDKVRANDKNVLRMTQDRMYTSKYDRKFPAYHLEFFLLPNAARKAKKKLPTFFKKYIFEGVERGIDMNVLELPEQPYFLGIICVRRKVGFEASGYMLNSPRLINWMICGMYPPQFPEVSSISLDFEPQNPANPSH